MAEVKDLERKALPVDQATAAKAPKPAPLEFGECELAIQSPIDYSVLVLKGDETDDRLLYKLGDQIFRSESPDIISGIKIDAEVMMLGTYSSHLISWDIIQANVDKNHDLRKFYDSSENKTLHIEQEAEKPQESEAEDQGEKEVGRGAKQEVTVTCFENASIGNVVTGAADGRTFLWNLVGEKCVQAWSDHTEKVSAIKYNNSNIYTVGYDGYFLMRNLEIDRIVHSYIHCSCPLSSLTLADPNLVYISSWDGSIRLLDLRSAHSPFQFQTENYSPVRCFVLHQDTMFVGHGIGHISSWDLRTRNMHRKSFHGHSDVVNSMLVHNGRLYSGSDDNTVRVFDITKGICVDALSGHSDGITEMEIVSDLFFTASYDGTVRRYKLSSIESAIDNRNRRMEEGKKLALELWLKQKEDAKNRKKKPKKTAKKSKA